MIIPKILKKSLEEKASDIIFTAWSKPALKIRGDVVSLEEEENITKEKAREEILSMMSDEQKKDFLENYELDFSIEMKWYSRFRVNCFSQKSWFWAVFRPISSEIPEFSNLNLEDNILDFAFEANWLVLVTWSVWSGKTTTLASLLNEINKNEQRHIITIEDPIEFVYKNDKSLFEQREIWTNTKDFDSWLKYSLRQAPDVILIWEMRDLETFRLALRAAETWNLVFATLHTSGAARTVARIIDMFPWDEKEQIRQQLSESLKWLVWQKLLKTKDGKSRVPATEILVNNTSVSNMIRKDVTHQIDNAIETWAEDWMLSMKKSLEKLFEKGLISEEDFNYHMYLENKFE